MANTATSNHEFIRRWAEERGAWPARVKGTGGGDDPGMIRIDFPGYEGGESLERISWDEWFDKFDERELALLYQEETEGGERSNFNKLISRETAEDRDRIELTPKRGGGGSRKSAAKQGSAGKRSAGKSSARKGAAKKSAAKKTSTKKAGTKRASTRKSAAKKRAASKSTAKKSTAKKSTAKKSAAKKSAAKKSAAKKSAAKKSSPRKSTAKTSRGRTTSGRR